MSVEEIRNIAKEKGMKLYSGIYGLPAKNITMIDIEDVGKLVSTPKVDEGQREKFNK